MLSSVDETLLKQGEQVITLQMAQQLKSKNINVVPGQLFCRQCKVKSLLQIEPLY